MNPDTMWDAVCSNDSDWDGVFFYGVTSTGIFCRPSCKSRPPRRENVQFFHSAKNAAESGFRPCKRCRPDLLEYRPQQEMAARIRQAIDGGCLDRESLSRTLEGSGVGRHRLDAIFLAEYGLTIREYVSRTRLSRTKTLLLHTDDPIPDIAYSVGFESVSAFYRFFQNQTGIPPARFRRESVSVEVAK